MRTPEDKAPKPKIEWRATDTEKVHDLFVDRRLVEYGVHVDDRRDALRRARIKP